MVNSIEFRCVGGVRSRVRPQNVACSIGYAIAWALDPSTPCPASAELPRCATGP